jgi:hypothetical protein
MAESARAGRPYESKAWRTILREGRLPKPAKQLIERDLDHGGSSTNTRVSNHRLTVGPLALELSAKVPRNLDKSVRWVEEK